jgi:hypothetical protein
MFHRPQLSPLNVIEQIEFELVERPSRIKNGHNGQVGAIHNPEFVLSKPVRRRVS